MTRLPPLQLALLSLGVLPACLPDFPTRDFVEDPTTDSDGDGFTEIQGDCDDTSALVYPGAQEICDERDNDCDGKPDEVEDLDDGNFATDGTLWYGDSDGDGYGTDAYTVLACTQPPGFAAADDDCDDTRPSIHPGAIEMCNRLDDDCDDQVDENGPDGAVDPDTWYLDGDRDGFGDDTVSYVGCDGQPGYVIEPGDCDDTQRTVYPGADEVCDGLDNDCDGATDDADEDGADDPATWYRDADGDGWGTSDDTMSACAPDAGYVADAGDCDDTVDTTFPLAAERCNEADDDCDGAVDEGVKTDFYRDADGDGHGDAAALVAACTAPSGFVPSLDDCDDGDAAISPSAAELCATAGVDDDCDGLTDEDDAADVPTWYLDADGDGFGDDAYESGDTTAPVPVQQCDTPLSHVLSGGDCDDGRDNVHPDATETCLTAYDDDCDDDDNDDDAESCTVFYADTDGDDYGDPADDRCLCTEDTATSHTTVVAEDCDDTDAAVSPDALEDCGTVGTDDDCDGTADEEDAVDCALYFYDYDGDGYGLPDSACLCAADGLYTAPDVGDCDDTDATTNPGAGNCGLSGVVTESSAVAVVEGREFSSNQRAWGVSAVVADADLSGDGIPDLFVGSPGASDYTFLGGAAFVLAGPISGTVDLTSTAHEVEYTGLASNGQAGTLISACDLDGDGLDERLVAPGGADLLQVLDGTSSGQLDSTTAGVSTLSTSVLSASQHVAVCVPDVSGDSIPEVFGAYLYGSSTGVGRGSTIAASLDSASEDWLLPSYQHGPNKGRQQFVASDTNGDGQADLVVSLRVGPGWYEGGAGLVFNYTGEDIQLTGHTGLDTYRTVQSIGDLDGDGYGDIAIGEVDLSTTDASGTNTGAGRVSVFLGGTPGLVSPSGSAAATASDAALFIDGADPYGAMGSQMAGLDVDGDGDRDLLVTSSYSSASSSTPSLPRLFYGPLSVSGGTISAATAEAVFDLPHAPSATASTPFPTAIAPAGDINADGYDDFWIGSETLYLFHGTPN